MCTEFIVQFFPLFPGEVVLSPEINAFSQRYPGINRDQRCVQTEQFPTVLGDILLVQKFAPPADINETVGDMLVSIFKTVTFDVFLLIFQSLDNNISELFAVDAERTESEYHQKGNLAFFIQCGSFFVAGFDGIFAGFA